MGFWIYAAYDWSFSWFVEGERGFGDTSIPSIHLPRPSNNPPKLPRRHSLHRHSKPIRSRRFHGNERLLPHPSQQWHPRSLSCPQSRHQHNQPNLMWSTKGKSINKSKSKDNLKDAEISKTNNITSNFDFLSSYTDFLSCWKSCERDCGGRLVWKVIVGDGRDELWIGS